MNFLSNRLWDLFSRRRNYFSPVSVPLRRKTCQNIRGQTRQSEKSSCSDTRSSTLAQPLLSIFAYKRRCFDFELQIRREQQSGRTETTTTTTAAGEARQIAALEFINNDVFLWRAEATLHIVHRSVCGFNRSFVFGQIVQANAGCTVQPSFIA